MRLLRASLFRRRSYTGGFMRALLGRLTYAVLVLLTTASLVAAQDIVTISGTVTTRADGLSVPGAQVSVVGSTQTAITDATGHYSLAVPRSLVRGDRLQVKVDALGLPAKVTEVVVSGATVTLDVALSLGFTEQVTVGSRAAGAEAEKAVPVDVLSNEEIASSGYTETAQVIQSLAPSCNCQLPSITDTTELLPPATLRGLG